MSLGQRLRRLREERRLTLAQVASAAGLSVSHLSAIENGSRPNPSFQIVARLASVYGVPMESLLDEADRSAARYLERERADASASYLDMARRLAEADALSHPARLLEVLAAYLREQEQAYEAKSQSALPQPSHLEAQAHADKPSPSTQGEQPGEHDGAQREGAPGKD